MFFEPKNGFSKIKKKHVKIYLASILTHSPKYVLLQNYKLPSTKTKDARRVRLVDETNILRVSPALMSILHSPVVNFADLVFARSIIGCAARPCRQCLSLIQIYKTAPMLMCCGFCCVLI